MPTLFDQLRANPENSALAKQAHKRLSRWTRTSRKRISEEQVKNKDEKLGVIKDRFHDAETLRIEDALLFWRSRAWTKTNGINPKTWIDVFFEKAPFFKYSETQGKLVQQSKTFVDKALKFSSKTGVMPTIDTIKELFVLANKNDPIDQYMVLKILEARVKKNRLKTPNKLTIEVELFQQWWGNDDDKQAMSNWLSLSNKDISTITPFQYYSIQRRLRYSTMQALDLTEDLISDSVAP